MVVVAQQWNLTPEAHEYYKVLKDILDNNSGLNAPPPAALIGNLFNPEDTEDFIFGSQISKNVNKSYIQYFHCVKPIG